MSGLLRARVARIGASPTRHSTRVLRATYPRAVSSLGRHGVLIGRDCITGNAFSFDPFRLYAETGLDHLSNPNLVVAGAVGTGKSNLVMSYTARQSLFARKERIFSVKRGEYDAWAQVTGASIVRVVPGGTSVVNPLDATVTGDPAEDGQIRPTRISIMAALAETRLGRELRPDEASALGLALDQVTATSDQPTLPDVLAVLQEPTGDMRSALRLSDEQWQHRLYDPITAFYNLCHGEYAGLFNGHTSPEMRLDADLVVFDLEPLSAAGRFALPMFMTVASGRLHNTLVKETQANLIVVYEESWLGLQDLGFVRYMQRFWKLARSYGVQNIMVIHRPSDLAAAGSEGSLAAKLADGLLRDTATKIVYRPEAHEREATGRMLALTTDEIAALSDLQVGEALWRIGDRSTIVRHQRSDLEARWFSTDASMVRQGAAV